MKNRIINRIVPEARHEPSYEYVISVLRTSVTLIGVKHFSFGYLHMAILDII